MKVMDEKQLIQLAKQGEADAYCTLVERYQAGVIIHCDRFVNNRQTAEDIAQDAFVKAYYSLNQYSHDKGAFSTWLYAVATNLAKDYIRKHRLHVNVNEIADVPAQTEQLSISEKREIRVAVKDLQPPEYAKVIEAFYWHGKRYEQIAAELNVPTSTVGTWLECAKVQLRKELA